jgi:hypothetical protein
LKVRLHYGIICILVNGPTKSCYISYVL